MGIRVTRGRQVSSCLPSTSFLSSPFATSFPGLKNFSLLNYADVVYVPVLNQHLLNRVQRIQNSCLRFSYCVRKYDHIFPYYRNLAGLRFGNILFSIYAVLYFLSFAPIFLYICDVSFSWILNIIPLLTLLSSWYQDYLFFPIYRSTKFHVAFSHTSVKYFNFLPDSIKISSSLSSFRVAASRFVWFQLLVYPSALLSYSGFVTDRLCNSNFADI